MTYPKPTGSGELADRLVRLSAIPAASPEDIPFDVKAEFEYIERQFGLCTADERLSAYRVICKTLEDIRAAKRKGESNFLFFKFLKLKKALSRFETKEPPSKRPEELEKQRLWTKIASDNFRVGKTEFPDSLHQFIAIGQESKYFRAVHHGNCNLPDSIPAVFVLNEDGLHRSMFGQQSANVISGHCIIGFEPHEDKLVTFLSAINRGLLLHDLFVYHHVRTFANHLGNRLRQIIISLDTIYYYHKVYQALQGALPRNEVETLVNSIAIAQATVIQQILPDGLILFEHEDDHRETLERIVNTGLKEFIVEEIKEYMGYDLRIHSEKAHALAYVAATYLYSPLILKQPAVAIESALNIEIPAKVVLPYLECRNMQHLFSFVALFPLQDTIMSHGVMYYGDARWGKIYSADSHEKIRGSILQMSRNLTHPHRCWFVNYFLARNYTIPDDKCHHTFCRLHQNKIIEDLLSSLPTKLEEGWDQLDSN
jgi:hypothetical protein